MSRLQEYRLETGMSQSQLAEAAGVSTRTLQDYEQGRKPIEKAAAETVLRIARAIGCTVEELLEGRADDEK